MIPRRGAVCNPHQQPPSTPTRPIQIRALAIRTLARSVGQAPSRLLPLVRAVWVDLLDTVMTALGGWVRASASAVASSSSSSAAAASSGQQPSAAGIDKGKRADTERAAAAATASSKAVEEPMRLLLALVRALRPRALLRPYARRFVQQISYLLLADAPAAALPAAQALSPLGTAAAANTGAAAASVQGRGAGGAIPSSSSSSSSSPPLLEGESLTAALAVVGELAVISPEDLRPYVDLLMPR